MIDGIPAAAGSVTPRLAPERSTTQRLHHPVIDDAGVAVYVQREDLVHPVSGGNKWRKLRYNLAEAHRRSYSTVLTFGGAWSNHLAAAALASRESGFRAIAIVRGEPSSGLTPTLEFARSQGMQLRFVDRATYRRRHETAYIRQLRDEYGDFYLVPEGGSNALALKGCAEIVDAVSAGFDIITTACGTGATLAGLASALEPGRQALGFAVLKNGGFLNDAVVALLSQAGLEARDNWRIEAGYAFGGYAKTTPALIDFIKAFRRDHDLMLDAVYTGKMFYGLFDLIRQGAFARGTRIVAVHTGGLQGNAGFPELRGV